MCESCKATTGVLSRFAHSLCQSHQIKHFLQRNWAPHPEIPPPPFCPPISHQVNCYPPAKGQGRPRRSPRGRTQRPMAELSRSGGQSEGSWKNREGGVGRGASNDLLMAPAAMKTPEDHVTEKQGGPVLCFYMTCHCVASIGFNTLYSEASFTLPAKTQIFSSIRIETWMALLECKQSQNHAISGLLE